jgi:hypothetical protein
MVHVHHRAEVVVVDVAVRHDREAALMSRGHALQDSTS